MLDGLTGFGSSIPGSMHLYIYIYFQFDEESKTAWHILHDDQGRSSLMLIPEIPSISFGRRGTNKQLDAL